MLGGGAVGKTCAADCKLAGREVRLYSRSEKSIAGLGKTGILLDGVQQIYMDLNAQEKPTWMLAVQICLKWSKELG